MSDPAPQRPVYERDGGSSCQHFMTKVERMALEALVEAWITEADPVETLRDHWCTVAAIIGRGKEAADVAERREWR